MPITFSASGNVRYAGQVIKMNVNSNYRAMSDVYTTAESALIWNPEKEKPEWKVINVLYMGSNSYGNIVVDIEDGEYAEDYAIWLLLEEDRKAEEARRYEEYKRNERIKAAKKACLSARKGLRCRVIKGRNVSKGTEGVIFYTRHQDYGLRIGFNDASGKAHWTYAHNVEIALDDLDFGEEPTEGWIAKSQEVNTSRSYRRY